MVFTSECVEIGALLVIQGIFGVALWLLSLILVVVTLPTAVVVKMVFVVAYAYVVVVVVAMVMAVAVVLVLALVLVLVVVAWVVVKVEGVVVLVMKVSVLQKDPLAIVVVLNEDTAIFSKVAKMSLISSSRSPTYIPTIEGAYQRDSVANSVV